MLAHIEAIGLKRTERGANISLCPPIVICQDYFLSRGTVEQER